MDCFPKIICEAGGCQRWQGQYWSFPHPATVVQFPALVPFKAPMEDSWQQVTLSLMQIMNCSFLGNQLRLFCCVKNKTRPGFAEQSWLSWRMFFFSIFISLESFGDAAALRFKWVSTSHAIDFQQEMRAKGAAEVNVEINSAHCAHFVVSSCQALSAL